MYYIRGLSKSMLARILNGFLGEILNVKWRTCIMDRALCENSIANGRCICGRVSYRFISRWMVQRNR